LNNAPKIRSGELRHFLESGGIIAYPTESCFGLGCDPRNRNAVKRLLQIKGRPQHKGLILIANSSKQLKPYIAPVSKTQKQQLAKTWPGPHTWLVPTAKNCPVWLTGRHTSIAVRVTAHALSSRLCRDAGMALVSTSANRSGCRPAKTSRECYKLFGTQVRIVNGLIGKARKPSTIQDLATGKIIRP
jgi:L-threonylcarbamoyladenylate synthase